MICSNCLKKSAGSWEGRFCTLQCMRDYYRQTLNWPNSPPHIRYLKDKDSLSPLRNEHDDAILNAAETDPELEEAADAIIAARCEDVKAARDLLGLDVE